MPKFRGAFRVPLLRRYVVANGPNVSLLRLPNGLVVCGRVVPKGKDRSSFYKGAGAVVQLVFFAVGRPARRFFQYAGLSTWGEFSVSNVLRPWGVVNVGPVFALGRAGRQLPFFRVLTSRRRDDNLTYEGGTPVQGAFPATGLDV